MNDDLRIRLAGLPSLSTDNRRNLSCKICAGPADIFDVVDFNKCCSWPIYQFGMAGIPVYYYRCQVCGFLFTSLVDAWTTDEIASFIYNDDYIKVDPEYMGARARRDADSFYEMIGSGSDLTILDYGSGNGVLANSLRNRGLDAESYDPFSSPNLPDRKFDVISCMEVIEHSPDPVATMREMTGLLEEGGCIFVGTQLQPDSIEIERAHWWYVSPRNGHVSVQSGTSIVELGSAAGLTCYPSGNLHGFASIPSDASRRLLGDVGRPTFNLRLSAPAETVTEGPQTSAADWHRIEDGSFRWTASEDVTWHWQPPSADCDINISLPCRMEIEPNFLSRSTLTIGDRKVATTVQDRKLTASASIAGRDPVRIVLRTPSLPTPYALRGFPDTRHLGLAVPV